MDFKDNVLGLAERIKVQRDAVKTEEATKTSFIMPMIYALGYDIFNPYEVIPEMDCDLTKRGDKIDYAIQKDGKTIILIECKHCTSNLNLHDTQLAKYYAASNARFAILTNGIEYRFYADLDKNNIMDEKPFLVVDMLDLDDETIEQLKKFHKEKFDECVILSTAQSLKYSTEIKKAIREELANPSWEFVKYFAKKTYPWSFGQKAYEQFTPIVKDCFASIVNDIIQDRLAIASKVEQKEDTMKVEETPSSNGIVTTEEELEGFRIIKGILGKVVPENKIIYTDLKSYFIISVLKKTYWICRLHLGIQKKYIGFPEEGYTGEKYIEIKSIGEIPNYSDLILKAYENARSVYYNWEKKDINEELEKQ